MDDAPRLPPPVSVPRDLLERGASFAFVNLVHRIRQVFGGSPIGTTGPVSREAVLFRSTPSLGFPASEVTAVTATPATSCLPWPIQLDVAFLGLYGPSSPLPAFWTERIVQSHDGAENLRDFLDLFGHPLVALAYRIWRHHRVERHFGADDDSTSAASILALAGVSAAPPQRDGRLQWARLLPLCGLLAQHTRSAETVRRVVSGYFGVPVQVEEWVRRKVDVPADQRFELGSPAAALGTGTLLGDCVPDAAGAVTIVLGPLPPSDFDSLLPDGARRSELEALMKLAVREPREVRIDLVFDGNGGGFSLGAGRIGWTAWLAGDGVCMRCPTGVV